MRWQGREQSDNIEDRRHQQPRRPRRRLRMPRFRVGGIGLSGLIVIAVVYFSGGDVGQLLNQFGLGGLTGAGGGVSNGSPFQVPGMNGGGATSIRGGQNLGSAREDELRDFVGVVLKETEDVWAKVFREQLNEVYTEPGLVVFTDVTYSGCGQAGSFMGPFYCPGDEKVYMDLKFSDELKEMGGDGDFALAYVVAHEVGHHVQNLLGTLDDVHRQKKRLTRSKKNALQVKVELQADFYAGVWAHYSRDLLEPGDIEEALSAASAVGDDRLQMEAHSYIVEESFTHGTSAQRMRWFQKGYKSGKISDGDTFNAARL